MTNSARILFDGKGLKLKDLGEGVREIEFDLVGESANRFSSLMLSDLQTAWSMVEKDSSARGVLLSTAKDGFFVGADVTEFLDHFKKPDAELEKWLWSTQELFSRIDDSRIPVVCLIKGFALGGGFEVALAAHYRLVTPEAKVGLPETKLGIFPGWGGTVRLSRLCSVDLAVEWICGGAPNSAAEALKVGAIDGIVPAEKLQAAGLRTLAQCWEGKLDWKGRNQQKKTPIQLSPIELTMAFTTSKAFVGAQAGPNYPAPMAAIETLEKGAKLSRDEALKIETRNFVKLTRTPQTGALVGVFLADQYVKRQSKKMSKAAVEVKSASVLGAGIMGGGIAYQSASSKIPVVMKDIREEALALGMKEASKLLEKQVEKGKLNAAKMGEILGRIRPSLSMSEIAGTDIVVEAVVENEKIKSQVLAETESTIRPDAILTSNTSTISISRLAKSLKRPENFCGMHFFNPVHRMPLVEIIRGEKSSEKAIATAVAYATAMGKTAIVVNDCPGFLVNRVLFPYFGGFSGLIRDGVDFQRIDKVMEKFGWPMGPAYLLDVVGIDTAAHAEAVMAEGFPDRMKPGYKNIVATMYEAKRFGQKNGKGFYNYTQDPKGRPKKEVSPEVEPIIQSAVAGKQDVTDEEILERMMLPMVFESSRCLEDKIVESAMELDLSLLYGLGFPPFRGGAMKYADSVGAKKLVELGQKYSATLGKMYEPTAQIREMAQKGSNFYSS
ncbi:MAG: fatty acid oxidation complex subunit alpha FadB [Bdellovibrionales bacterium]|nr:fatty acid oxidation complex subunit alpha FadB [Bdellovibrionales bacterium]